MKEENNRIIEDLERGMRYIDEALTKIDEMEEGLKLIDDALTEVKIKHFKMYGHFDLTDHSRKTPREERYTGEATSGYEKWNGWFGGAF